MNRSLEWLKLFGRRRIGNRSKKADLEKLKKINSAEYPFDT